MKQNFLATLSVRFLIPVFLVLSAAPNAQPQPSSADPRTSGKSSRDKLQEVKSLLEKGDTAKAEKALLELYGNEADRSSRQLELFALGLLAYRQVRDGEAQTYFQQYLQEKPMLEDYARYYLALSFNRVGELAKARSELQKVMSESAPKIGISKALAIDVRSQLAEIDLQEKKWTQARDNLEWLRKQAKQDSRYPQFLFHLLRVSRHTSVKGSRCQIARDLYSKFPAHASVVDWGLNLSRNQVDGERVDCTETLKDQQARWKRLQLSGESDRALTEIRALREANSKNSEMTYSLDALLANVLVSEGHPDDAVRLLLPHFEVQGSRVGYLLLLAKATSRLGEFHAAIGSYRRVFEIAGNSKQGKHGLFQAAFTSYQAQDYDGATRGFQEFLRLNGGASQAREAKWYIAWVQYLRGDYPLALQSFSKIAQEKAPVRRRGRRNSKQVQLASDAVSNEKVQYWIAMTLARMGDSARAKQAFEKIASHAGFSYYSILARYRLQVLPQINQNLDVRITTVSAAESAKLRSEAVAAVAHDDATDEADDGTDTNDEKVTTGTTAASSPMQTASGVSTPNSVADAEAMDEEEESDASDEANTEDADDTSHGRVVDVQFQNERINRRFERARDLALLGQKGLARGELNEVEQLARTPSDKQNLLIELENLGVYHRSSYLGEIAFGGARVRGGFEGARRLWEFTYPRAFRSSVEESAQVTDVNEHMIWSIMRAESQYRVDALSQVGALGLMQLMPFTARKVSEIAGIKSFQVSQLLEPETNIKLGTFYLRRLSQQFEGKLPLVAAGYNAGPHRVVGWLRSFGLLDMDEFIEHIPYLETRNYVKKVMRNWQLYHMLYSGNASTQMAAGSRAGQSLWPAKWLVQPVGVRAPEGASLSRETW